MESNKEHKNSKHFGGSKFKLDIFLKKLYSLIVLHKNSKGVSLT